MASSASASDHCWSSTRLLSSATAKAGSPPRQPARSASASACLPTPRLRPAAQAACLGEVGGKRERPLGGGERRLGLVLLLLEPRGEQRPAHGLRLFLLELGEPIAARPRRQRRQLALARIGGEPLEAGAAASAARGIHSTTLASKRRGELGGQAGLAVETDQLLALDEATGRSARRPPGRRSPPAPAPAAPGSRRAAAPRRASRSRRCAGCAPRRRGRHARRRRCLPAAGWSRTDRRRRAAASRRRAARRPASGQAERSRSSAARSTRALPARPRRWRRAARRRARSPGGPRPAPRAAAPPSRRSSSARALASPGARQVGECESEATKCTSPSSSSSHTRWCGPRPKSEVTAAAVTCSSAPALDQRAEPRHLEPGQHLGVRQHRPPAGDDELVHDLLGRRTHLGARELEQHVAAAGERQRRGRPAARGRRAARSRRAPRRRAAPRRAARPARRRAPRPARRGRRRAASRVAAGKLACRWCGVATMTVQPSAAARRHMATASARFVAPSSTPGRMWQCRSITVSGGFRPPRNRWRRSDARRSRRRRGTGSSSSSACRRRPCRRRSG